MTKASHELSCARAVMLYVDATMEAHHVDRVVFMDELLALVSDRFKEEVYQERRLLAA